MTRTDNCLKTFTRHRVWEFTKEKYLQVILQQKMIIYLYGIFS